MSAAYEKDFYAWANEQAALLRAGRLNEADIAHIAEEIESMGKAEQRELVSRLTVLLLHLLKWRVQPGMRGGSWEATIKVQRRDLSRLLRDNPSLKSKLDEAMGDAYGDAIILAASETGLSEASLPSACLWSFEQAMDAEFWPE
ncbi:DUF29 domain-containing protein [Methylocystis bryophila]|uniref:DUF29 domain-containing protein n=1 Tax=Methylocystis bryophila TaxID=655015 RepID=A0A1W6MUV6_9HYPH|nr:DUF29 domain-containing protein [Methylocystis bryophila]ARN81296.1 hypothetical protein B1812_09630 [Methylocystis bryophila]BDV37262.1 hypothetical protein DSM21852_05150 [Methylocystis bryophila]